MAQNVIPQALLLPVTWPYEIINKTQTVHQTTYNEQRLLWTDFLHVPNQGS